MAERRAVYFMLNNSNTADAQMLIVLTFPTKDQVCCSGYFLGTMVRLIDGFNSIKIVYLSLLLIYTIYVGWDITS